MSGKYSHAGPAVYELLDHVRAKSHPELNMARFAARMEETKPFVKNQLNLGSIKCFRQDDQMWFPQDKKYNFRLSLCVELWHEMLNAQQKEALIDLHLERCAIERVPLFEVVNGKKKVSRDQYGRVNYSEDIKCDDDGNPCWMVRPLTISIWSANVKRYGTWFDDLVELKHAVEAPNE